MKCKIYSQFKNGKPEKSKEPIGYNLITPMEGKKQIAIASNKGGKTIMAQIDVFHTEIMAHLIIITGIEIDCNRKDERVYHEQVWHCFTED
jgi:hypothetical protein